MKFFISIIMVLLMLNLFAQAQVVAADPAGATAVPVDDKATVVTVDPTSSYATTMTGGPQGQKKTDTEGKEPDCEFGDGQRRCTPSPNKVDAFDDTGAATLAAPAGQPAKTTKKVKTTK